MYRVKETFEHTIEIEKSRFICYLHRAFNDDEAKAFLQQIKKQHPKATHWCYALRIGENNEIQRSNDNGEPSGTAGVPILDALTKNNMQDTIAIVVRYFGGIKLGAGGLIRAYSKSTSEAIKYAPLTQKVYTSRYTYQFSYDLVGKIDHYFRVEDIDILDKHYDEAVLYEFLTTKDIATDLQELSNGQGVLNHIEDTIVEIDVKNKN